MSEKANNHKMVQTKENEEYYKEKKWGGNEGGEYITDGYVVRGKCIFNKALEGLKEILKKGFDRDINGIKYKALDIRKKGAGLEMDIEVFDKDIRGVAILKLYGPNSKKENVVTVTKSRESDSKYVQILAEQVVK